MTRDEAVERVRELEAEIEVAKLKARIRILEIELASVKANPLPWGEPPLWGPTLTTWRDPETGATVDSYSVGVISGGGE